MTGIIGMYVMNKVVFLHSHKLSDGTVIEHAHPYNKSSDSKPFKSHHHTKGEFLFFQNIDTLFVFVFFTLVLSAGVNKPVGSFYIIKKQVTNYRNQCKSRAPPIS